MEQELIQGTELLSFQPTTTLTLISRGRVTSLPIDTITHITKIGGVTRIHTRKNSYQTYDSLLSLMKDLPVNDFFQVGRSHIVSLKSIKKIVNCAIVLENHVVLLSPHYRVQLELQLKRILEGIVIFYEDQTQYTNSL